MLLDEFPSRKGGKLKSDYGGTGIKAGTSTVKDFGETFQQWDSYISSEKFSKLMEQITGINKLLYDPYYQGAGIHENFEGYRSNVHM